ncbi:PnuC protein [Hahella sp. KA22]|uniref:PnuC protein n=1 Tax=Hahella sp. KA22 TaxID=1628392 RepID=UPI000FDF36CC|nr:PnuC protein [Hahella sp. KA22]AZZ90280.1 PnuC protein [Hahella sp. KA22]QAY53650.1 PnuC protein [Hahella sp. KA22]
MDMRFYGVDWIAMLLTFVAVWQIGNKNKTGFWLMMLANVGWMMVGIMGQSTAIFLANAVFLSMNWRAASKWAKQETTAHADTA